ncbi:MAG: gliding motility lipoprotein GldH [Alteromonas sp.]|nr:gliding motility lipoprotein GldH [Alteromonas sp.]MAY23876.1 gliding motility lipoprotein GldH [Flavobacteriaceae bacterium]|tara:strand:- start:42349 stop:42831 length:483 start_codon:yes stop_codon:yes gene_type:complete
MPKLFLLFLFIGMCVSCDSNIVVSEMKSLPGYWGQNEKLEFVIPELDSLKTYHVFFHVRNTNEYPYNNIYIIANIQFPHGKTVIDTLEYRMAAPDGSWLGTGIGGVKESKLWYKENVSFFEEGNYILTVSQAVRNNGEVSGVSQLKGITEVGYSIEEATP